MASVCAAAAGVVTANPPSSEASPPGIGTSVPITYNGSGRLFAAAVRSAMTASSAERAATMASGSGVGSSAQDMLQSR
ncbi:hypothetical protein D3C71_1788700 [compost metagenome]